MIKEKTNFFIAKKKNSMNGLTISTNVRKNKYLFHKLIGSEEFYILYQDAIDEFKRLCKTDIHIQKFQYYYEIFLITSWISMVVFSIFLYYLFLLIYQRWKHNKNRNDFFKHLDNFKKSKLRNYFGNIQRGSNFLLFSSCKIDDKNSLAIFPLSDDVDNIFTKQTFLRHYILNYIYFRKKFFKTMLSYCEYKKIFFYTHLQYFRKQFVFKNKKRSYNQLKLFKHRMMMRNLRIFLREIFDTKIFKFNGDFFYLIEITNYEVKCYIFRIDSAKFDGNQVQFGENNSLGVSEYSFCKSSNEQVNSLFQSFKILTLYKICRLEIQNESAFDIFSFILNSITRKIYGSKITNIKKYSFYSGNKVELYTQKKLFRKNKKSHHQKLDYVVNLE